MFVQSLLPSAGRCLRLASLSASQEAQDGLVVFKTHAELRVLVAPCLLYAVHSLAGESASERLHLKAVNVFLQISCAIYSRESH